ncbi:uncharacterized protein LOC119074641 [Bradysia coprophila]|uniref:uncharacterized protein LOC119074641 n=1 Tax=Bradysia coprophila TaxID=38358 RepID=UPI00187D99C5|nr:uncharacterized protein LOC119074641 [Bradysia coprophila]
MKLHTGVLRNSLRQTMSERQVPVFVRNLLNEISEKNGFANPTMRFENGSNPGDGFTSNIVRAIISERNTDKNLRLVYKLAPENKSQRNGFNSSFTFANEANFYNKLMPIFTKFQVEKNLPKENQFSLIPKCYAAVADDNKEEYALIFEDLRSQGFSMWDRSKACPVENIRLGIREIGKFHAISIAMKDQHPDRFAEFKKLTEIAEKFLDTPDLLQMFDTSFERSISVLKSDEHKDIYRQIRTNIKKHFVDCFEEKPHAQFGVMSHGDFWTNNCVYRFVNDTDIANDIRILDWQTVGYTTPAIDVLFSLFISTDKALRDTEYQNLLRLYYQTLSQTVKLLGSNPDKLFTFENLQSELKRVGSFVLLVAPFYKQLSHAKATELTNWNVMCDNVGQGGEQQELYTLLSEAGKRAYERTLNDVVGDVVRMGYYRN